ncbi:hypothetical protein [Arthrobacter woluwensis]|uniref:hypothetical protein n=1 Tax=Arthrobacter woluwensis TaxID=156980 RepID=UPI0011A845F6|nr:hypothetical protein [Arthrobacter woluwensis]
MEYRKVFVIGFHPLRADRTRRGLPFLSSHSVSVADIWERPDGVTDQVTPCDMAGRDKVAALACFVFLLEIPGISRSFRDG